MFSNTQEYNVIGLMSGTSLDGTDLAACTFRFINNQWTYNIVAAETRAYPNDLKTELAGLYAMDARNFSRFHAYYGHYLGKLVAEFALKTKFQAEFVASHGHTIFHDPQTGYTAQIGDGAAIAFQSKLPVVCDFRTSDVAAGGQGAPLVPIGDKLLFGSYDACLNLGGIANISMDYQGSRIAYDICPVNMAFNFLSNQLGFEYDDDGRMAESGKTIQALLNQFLQLDYFAQTFPKSLGREWFENNMLPLIKTDDKTQIPDLLRTCLDLASIQIANNLNKFNIKDVMVTGGGAFNKFLLNSIRKHTLCNIEVPDSVLVNFKEALIFAFLGVLRWNNQANCLASVTGANKNVCGGAIYLP